MTQSGCVMSFWNFILHMAYQLYYFDMRGRAEPIRLLFALANVPYQDIRVKHEDFPRLKQTLPYGQLPILKLDNGLVLSQSPTIARFLAKRFNLRGNDEFESAQIDEICDAIVDHELAYWACFGPKLDEETKHSRFENYLTVLTSKYFTRFNQILEQNGGKFLVGKNITFADLRVVNHIEFFSELTQLNLVEHYALLKNLVKNINENPRIQKWMLMRPRSCVRKEEEEYDAFQKFE